MSDETERLCAAAEEHARPLSCEGREQFREKARRLLLELAAHARTLRDALASYHGKPCGRRDCATARADAAAEAATLRDALAAERARAEAAEARLTEVSLRSVLDSRESAALALTAVNDRNAAREEVAALRRLPVVKTCGDCGWFRGDDGSCKLRRGAVIYAARNAAPPSTCPLRGER